MVVHGHLAKLRQGVDVFNRWREDDAEVSPQLSSAELSGIALPGIDLNGSDLSGADLSNTDLGGADLSNADLSNADLSGADLENAELSGADLSSANLDGTNLVNADLSAADLNKADLSSSNLSGADLSATDLSGADLSEANVSGADLSGAYLYDADLISAKLHDANLCDANLRLADLSSADLTGALLVRANLTATTLDNSSFKNATLANADLRNGTVTVPDTTDRSLDYDMDPEGVTSSQTRRQKEEVATTVARVFLGGADLSNARLPESLTAYNTLKVAEETARNARKIFVSILLGCAYSVLTIGTTTDDRLFTNSSSSPLPIIGSEIPIVGFYIIAPLLLFCLFVYQHLYLQRLWDSLSELPARFPDGKTIAQRIYPWMLNGLVISHSTLLRAHRPPFSRLQSFAAVALAWWTVPLTLVVYWWRYLYKQSWLGSLYHVVLVVIAVGAACAFQRRCGQTLRSDGPHESRNNLLLSIPPMYATAIVMLTATVLGLGGEHITVKPFAGMDLRRAANVSKPSTWPSTPSKKELDGVVPADWAGKSLRSSDLRGAFLVRANLLETALDYADLREAELLEANLTRASLRRATLQLADLRRADLGDADLAGANVSGANLRAASLQYAKVVEADLSSTDLSRTSLFKADLLETNLRAAVLTDAVLTGANLTGTNLADTSLRGANLRAAILTNASNWSSIRSMTLCNVYGVEDAPAGFLTWAVERMGAVSVESDEEWQSMKDTAAVTR